MIRKEPQFLLFQDKTVKEASNKYSFLDGQEVTPKLNVPLSQHKGRYRMWQLWLCWKANRVLVSASLCLWCDKYLHLRKARNTYINSTQVSLPNWFLMLKKRNHTSKDAYRLAFGRWNFILYWQSENLKFARINALDHEGKRNNHKLLPHYILCKSGLA